MPSSRRSVSARGGAKPAEDGRGSSTAQTRAQELGTAMLNAARPVLSARMNNQGYPIPITAKEVFTFLDQLAAYNGRTKDVMDNALVLEQVDDRVKFLVPRSIPESQISDDGRGRRQREPEATAGIRRGLESEGIGGPRSMSKVGQGPYTTRLAGTVHVQQDEDGNGIGAGHAQRCQADEGGTNRLGNYANARQGVPRTA